MLARHPKTGAPIRIMKSDASVWRDQKTLLWVDGANATASLNAAGAAGAAGRWDIGAVGLGAAASLQANILLCVNDDPAAVAAWLDTGVWHNYMMVCLPQSTIQAIGVEKFRAYGLKNLVCLDELHTVYPFLGPAWTTGSVDDAKVMIAMVLRCSRVGPVDSSAVESSRAAASSLKLLPAAPSPPPLWLITQYYNPSQTKRRREVTACLQANLANPLVDRVILLNESAGLVQPSAHPKITEVVIGHRLAYADVLRWIADQPEDAIVAFANADIFLDTETTKLLWSVDLADKFLALLRWEVTGTDEAARAAAKLFGPRPDSQDTWVVDAASVRRAFPDGVPPSFEIPFGKGGCDNAITVEMLRKKFQVANPAVNLRTFHYHTSQVRTYDPKDIVDRPAYMYVEPTGIHDMQPVKRLTADLAESTIFKGRAVARPVKGPVTPAQAATFCRMVERASNGVFKLDAAGQNVWAPPPVPLYSFKGATFQTREGLPYGYNSIFIGPTAASAEAWSKARLGVLAAALEVDSSFAVPITDAVAGSPAEYCTKYLAKVFLMRKMLRRPVVDMWCAKEARAALGLFRWTAGPVPIVSREEVVQMWSKELAAWLPHDGGADLVTAEEVEALREAFLGWEASAAAEADTKRLVIVVDERYLTEEVAEGIEREVEGVGLSVKVVYAGRTNLEAMAAALRGAWGYVSATPSAQWLWMLPRGAVAWEVQSEMEPSAAGLHLAAAAAVEHRLAIHSKGALTPADRSALINRLAGSVLEELERVVDGKASLSDKPLPVIRMPTGHQGRFDHAGDSFREMARLWAAAGYVSVVDDPDVTQVWLEAGGKRNLLYDRPTLEWLAAAPAAELKALEAPGAKALFGNPAAPPTPGAQPWFFWPRRPALVERIAAGPSPATSFSARNQALVFYGRSENAVQRGRRCAADWASACTDFVHVDGLKPYPFMQEEYLHRLAAARFGLCLAGYGLKCHREVECMAMGCVPIVAPEVDMTNYAVPPQEGVHYFCAADPDEARRIAATTSEDEWSTMSAACRAWWRANASVAGSWALTARLLEL